MSLKVGRIESRKRIAYITDVVVFGNVLVVVDKLIEARSSVIACSPTL